MHFTSVKAQMMLQDHLLDVCAGHSDHLRASDAPIRPATNSKGRGLAPSNPRTAASKSLSPIDAASNLLEYLFARPLHPGHQNILIGTGTQVFAGYPLDSKPYF